MELKGYTSVVVVVTDTFTFIPDICFFLFLKEILSLELRQCVVRCLQRHNKKGKNKLLWIAKINPKVVMDVSISAQIR